jgi:hypothetical protein
LKDVDRTRGGVEVSTAVFGSLGKINMELYEYTASPILYTGQTATAKIEVKGSDSVKVDLRLHVLEKTMSSRPWMCLPSFLLLLSRVS